MLSFERRKIYKFLNLLSINDYFFLKRLFYCSRFIFERKKLIYVQ